MIVIEPEGTVDRLKDLDAAVGAFDIDDRVRFLCPADILREQVEVWSRSDRGYPVICQSHAVSRWMT